MKNQKIILIASDHAGKKLKDKTLKVLEKEGYYYENYSPKNTATDDYPDYAKKVCEAVLSSQNSVGLLICGSGIGMSIAANKIKGIRAALVTTKKEAELARKDNDANILILPGSYSSTKLSERKIKTILDAFINTNFSGGRHKRRIEKIDML